MIYLNKLHISLIVPRMINCQEKALENLKLGLYDVLPTSCLEGLTAEDFRLLVNGVSDITRNLIIT